MIFIISKNWRFACNSTLFRIWLCFFPCLFFQGTCNNRLPAFTGAEQLEPNGSSHPGARGAGSGISAARPGRPGHPTSSGTQRWVSANASFPCHLFQRRHVTGPAARNTATKYRHCQGTSGNCLCQKMRLREIFYPASAFPHLLLNTRKNYTLYIWRRILSNNARQNLVFITLYQLLLCCSAVQKYWQISDLCISFISEQAKTHHHTLGLVSWGMGSVAYSFLFLLPLL